MMLPVTIPDLIPEPGKIGWRTAYAETTIHAPRDRVWSILTDFPAYNTWNPFTYDLKMSRFAVGEIFQFTVRMNRRYIRTQPELLMGIEPPGCLVWGMTNPGRHLSPVRYQLLTALDARTTRYQTWETFTGYLGPLAALLVRRDVTIGFQDVANGLKAAAEMQLQQGRIQVSA